MTRKLLITGIGLLLLTGCLPIELDVTPTGEVLIPRGEGFFAYNPTTGKVDKAHATTAAPVFALAVPNRGGLVAITEGGGGGMGSGHQVEYVDATGKAKSITSASNITYAQVSADGKRMSFTRLGDQSSEGFDENLPELKVVSTEGGAVTKLVSNIGIVHRWMPDAKSIVVMKLDTKDEDTDRYTGRIALADSTSGNLTELASVIGPDGVFLELSPDGKKVLFTAEVAGKAGAMLTAPGEDDEEVLKLFELDIAAKTVKEVWPMARFAIYSPKGTKVLIGGNSKDEMIELIVTSATFSGETVVANDAAEQAGGMANSVDIYPGWYDDNTVLYIAKKKVFGTAGVNFMLATVKADGSDKKLHQAAVDAAAAK